MTTTLPVIRVVCDDEIDGEQLFVQSRENTDELIKKSKKISGLVNEQV